MSKSDRSAGRGLPAPSPPPALLDRHRDTIRRYRLRSFADRTPPQLVPLDAIAALRREVTAPAPVDQVAEGVKQLVGCFKVGNVVTDPAQFTEAMVEELSRYPLAVLRAAAREARRSLDWLPSIAEMVRLCEREMEPRRQLLLTLDEMQREHQWRNRPPEPKAARAIEPPPPDDDAIRF